MNKITMTKGLPGCGKSTWSREKVKDEIPGTVIINNDSLRKMFNDSYWFYDKALRKDTEKFVIAARDALICLALDYNKDVIVDETNLSQRSERHVRDLVSMHTMKDVEIEIKDFTSIPLETCLQNDMKRDKSVGESVIRRMHKDFIAPKKEIEEQQNENADVVKTQKPAWNSKYPNAILCDVDGTLAEIYGRNPYDTSYCDADGLHHHIASLLFAIEKYGWKIILVSGRSEEARDMTQQWLCDNLVGYDALFMRKEDDYRKDYIVKQEIYDNEIKDKYNVMFVLDDRNQTVNMWRNLGLNCLQVAEGNF